MIAEFQHANKSFLIFEFQSCVSFYYPCNSTFLVCDRLKMKAIEATRRNLRGKKRSNLLSIAG